jgi:hypothetical protein
MLLFMPSVLAQINCITCNCKMKELQGNSVNVSRYQGEQTIENLSREKILCDSSKHGLEISREEVDDEVMWGFLQIIIVIIIGCLLGMPTLRSSPSNYPV